MNNINNMNKMTPISLCLLLALSCGAEPAPNAPKELAAMELITGLHTHFNKDAGFEYRIIEVDGSSTVALNPICLYLVVTNNSSGDDLQSRMVRLPKVSAFKRVRFNDERSVIHIDVMMDRQSDDGAQTFDQPATIVISAPIKEGRLSKTIDVVVDQSKVEKVAAPKR